MSILQKYKDRISPDSHYCAGCGKTIKKHTAFYSMSKSYMGQDYPEDDYHFTCLDVINLVLDLVAEEAVTLTLHEG
jgi:hypothetical protein